MRRRKNRKKKRPGGWMLELRWGQEKQVVEREATGRMETYPSRAYLRCLSVRNIW
jgi:hypothetical protein